MNIYGPSAATGLAAGSSAGLLTGNLMTGMFLGLGAFTLLSAGGAALRALPKIRRHHSG